MRSIPIGLVLGPLLAVPAAAQVPALRPGAALPADTLRSSAIEQLQVDDGRLVVTGIRVTTPSPPSRS